MEKSRKRWWIERIAIALVAGFLVIQLVPYGRDHASPAVTASPSWDSPRTKSLFMQACGDCHSNLTDWRWYTNVAPVSWLVQHDVDDGRAVLNVSRWDQPQPDAGELVENVRSGEMPPLQYKLIHSSARLSDAEKAALAAGLARTYAQSPPASTRGG